MGIKKGWIKNNKTKVLRNFPFNPTSLAHSRGATYVEFSSPGLSYPIIQYTGGGSRKFPVEIFIYDKPYTKMYETWRKFLYEFLPPENNNLGYSRPPTMLFCLGNFVKTCVLEELQESEEEFTEKGDVMVGTFTLTLRQVD
jgi:hypothetical protein